MKKNTITFKCDDEIKNYISEMAIKNDATISRVVFRLIKFAKQQIEKTPTAFLVADEKAELDELRDTLKKIRELV